MKNLVYIILVVLTITSCNDDEFLTQTSPDSLTTDIFFRDTTDCEAALAAAYTMLSPEYYLTTETFMTGNFYASDCTKPGSDAVSNYPEWINIKNFTVKSKNMSISNYWYHYYSGIMYANQIIDNLNIKELDVSDDYKKQVIGEARFLRAFYHYKLLTHWEKIIYRDKYVNSAKELSQPLNERILTLEIIANEFELAAVDLPKSYDSYNKGRATKGAAYAFAGNTYLNLKNHQKAILNYEAVKALNKYDLIDDPLSMFVGKNKHSEESIFEVNYTKNESGGRWLGSDLGHYTAPKKFGGWGSIEASDFYYKEAKKEGEIASNGKYDARLYWFLFSPESDDVYGQTYQEAFPESYEDGGVKRLYLRKYMHRDVPQKSNSFQSDFNIIKMRYANVLLSLAEAYVSNNESSKAIPLINKVRSRANMPDVDSSDDLMAVLRHERIMELSFEGERLMDLMRWDLLGINNKTDFKTEPVPFWPIPQKEIDTNTKL